MGSYSPCSTSRMASTCGCGDARFTTRRSRPPGPCPRVEQIVHLHKRAYVDGLTHLAREACAADPEMLGNQIALLYEGASGLSTSLNDPAPWAQARVSAQVLIDLATTRAA